MVPLDFLFHSSLWQFIFSGKKQLAKRNKEAGVLFVWKERKKVVLILCRLLLWIKEKNAFHRPILKQFKKSPSPEKTEEKKK